MDVGSVGILQYQPVWGSQCCGLLLELSWPLSDVGVILLVQTVTSQATFIISQEMIQKRSLSIFHATGKYSSAHGCKGFRERKNSPNLA